MRFVINNKSSGVELSERGLKGMYEKSQILH